MGICFLYQSPQLHNQRLLLAGRERLGRRAISSLVIRGGCGTRTLGSDWPFLCEPFPHCCSPGSSPASPR